MVIRTDGTDGLQKSSGPRRLTILALGAAGLLVAGSEVVPGPTVLAEAGGRAPAAQGGAVRDRDQPVLRFSDLMQVGTSQLVRTPNGVNFKLRATGLEPGHAYTLWIVAFNETAGCLEPTEISFCGPSDVVNDAAQPDMMYAAGRIASGTGTATFAGHLGVGANSGSLNAPVGLPAYGLLDPYGAEIHLVVHHHGPKLPGFMPDMIQTVAGGCTDAGIPEAGVPSPFNEYMGPEYGRRGPNTCSTIYFAVHKP